MIFEFFWCYVSPLYYEAVIMLLSNVLMNMQEEISNVVSTVLFVSGLTTLLHISFGSRLPLIQGPSFVYLAPALAIINSPELQGLNGNDVWMFLSSFLYVFDDINYCLYFNPSKSCVSFPTIFVIHNITWDCLIIIFASIIETRKLIRYLCHFAEIQAYNEGASGGYYYWVRLSSSTWIYRTYVTLSKV